MDLRSRILVAVFLGAPIAMAFSQVRAPDPERVAIHSQFEYARTQEKLRHELVLKRIDAAEAQRIADADKQAGEIPVQLTKPGIPEDRVFPSTH